MVLQELWNEDNVSEAMGAEESTTQNVEKETFYLCFRARMHNEIPTSHASFLSLSDKILDSKRGIQCGLQVASMMAKEDLSGVQILTSANLSSASRNRVSQSAFSRSHELKKLSMTRSKNLCEASARRKTKPPCGQ